MTQEQGPTGVEKDEGTPHNVSREPTEHLPPEIRRQLHDGEKVECSVLIMRPANEVFSYWRDFGNLPKFMTHLERIDLPNPKQAHWVWHGLAGVRLEWDTEIIAERPDRMISWQTLPGSAVSQAGSVWFKPARLGHGTRLYLHLRYHAPGGSVAKAIASLFGEDPAKTLREDLRRLRWILEAGEIPTTVGQPHGTRGLIH